MPQDQLRPLKLPPDPIPVKNPRTEPFAVDQNAQAFQNYTLYVKLASAVTATKTQVLAALASASGVPTPAVTNDYGSTIAQQNVAQQIMPANGARQWGAIYNASSAQLQISLAAALWGVPTNLIVGPGEAILTSASLGLFVPVGVLSGIGLLAPAPYFAWDG